MAAWIATALVLLAAAPETAAPARAESRAEDPAWALYDRAFMALARDERDESVDLLQQLAVHHPLHPASVRGRILLLRLRDEDRALGRALRDEQPTGLARAELITGQAAFGVASGLGVCLILQCGDSRAWVAAGTIGAGAALSLTVALTIDRGVTPGHTLALNTGSAWGLWNGVAGARAFGLSTEQRGFGIAMLSSELVGVALGEVAHRWLEPGAGDVSLAGTAGLWTGLIVTFMHGINSFDVSERVLYGTILLASDAGFVLGALLGNWFPMSRSRVLVLDASAMLGGLLAAGVDWAIEGNRPRAPSLYTFATLGVVLGFGTAVFMTRNWDREELPPLDLSLLPTESGFIVGARGRF